MRGFPPDEKLLRAMAGRYRITTEQRGEPGADLMTGSTSSRSTGSQTGGGDFTPASPEGWPELLEGLTFDDVLLVPQRSDLLPREVNVDTRIARNVPLHIPFASAAMDTVTEWRLAVSLAREGGIGIIHRNLGWEGQIREVDKVKRSANGVIEDPVTLGPAASMAEARDVMRRHNRVIDTRLRRAGLEPNNPLPADAIRQALTPT